MSTTLKQIQEDFYRHIIDKKDGAILKYTEPNPGIEQRFSIYRFTVYEKLRRALEISFPSVWKYLGEKAANNAAYAFLQTDNIWPEHPVLDTWGEDFIDFLKTLPPFPNKNYLVDCATVDWLKQFCHYFSERQARDNKLLKEQFDLNPEQFLIKLHPGVFLFQSQYVLHSFDDITSLKPSLSFAAIFHYQQEVYTHWITEDLFIFLKLSKEDIPLIRIVDAVLEKHPDFNIQKAIDFLFRYSLLA